MTTLQNWESLLKENNEMLKEILSILRDLTSKEHNEQEDLKNLAINLIANSLANCNTLNNKPYATYKATL